jgi:hypothetical protein
MGGLKGRKARSLQDSSTVPTEGRVLTRCARTSSWSGAWSSNQGGLPMYRTADILVRSTFARRGVAISPPMGFYNTGPLRPGRSRSGSWSQSAAIIATDSHEPPLEGRASSRPWIRGIRQSRSLAIPQSQLRFAASHRGRRAGSVWSPVQFRAGSAHRAGRFRDA